MTSPPLDDVVDEDLLLPGDVGSANVYLREGHLGLYVELNRSDELETPAEVAFFADDLRRTADWLTARADRLG